MCGAINKLMQIVPYPPPGGQLLSRGNRRYFLTANPHSDYAILTTSSAVGRRGKNTHIMKLLTGLIGLTTTMIGVVIFAVAAHATTYGGGDVQRYQAESSFDNGTIVQLVDPESRAIARAPAGSPDKMFGVVVNPNQLPLRIQDDSIENEIHVSSSGTYNVLVSTQAGAIRPGDFVTLSAVSGVAMKASEDDGIVFGRAAGAFDGTSTAMGSTTLKDSDGRTRQVALGTVPVTIDIRNNPNEISTKVNVPEPLERVGQAIAEKEVDPIRIYLSLAITLIGSIAAIVVIYAGVRNSMISIGRNPMSKKSIFRALLEIILTSVLILIISLFAVYLLLRL